MGISLWQLLIVLVIVLLLFGTKKLRHLGTDLGSAVRGFKSAIKDGGAEVDADRIENEEGEGEQVVDASEVAPENVTEKSQERA